MVKNQEKGSGERVRFNQYLTIGISIGQIYTLIVNGEAEVAIKVSTWPELLFEYLKKVKVTLVTSEKSVVRSC